MLNKAASRSNRHPLVSSAVMSTPFAGTGTARITLSSEMLYNQNHIFIGSESWITQGVIGEDRDY
jgi:hypothetical protein